MANIEGAKKRARQDVKRNARNTVHSSRMRSRIRKVDEAVASGDATVAAAALSEAESEVARASQRGLLHRKSGSRKISRLSARVRALKA